MEKTSDQTPFFTYTSPLDDHHDYRLPGEQYDLQQQCQLALGDQYQPYISKRSPFNVIIYCNSNINWFQIIQFFYFLNFLGYL